MDEEEDQRVDSALGSYAAWLRQRFWCFFFMQIHATGILFQLAMFLTALMMAASTSIALSVLNSH